MDPKTIINQAAQTREAQKQYESFAAKCAIAITKNQDFDKATLAYWKQRNAKEEARLDALLAKYYESKQPVQNPNQLRIE